jgi:hypothetical protein
MVARWGSSRLACSPAENHQGQHHSAADDLLRQHHSADVDYLLSCAMSATARHLLVLLVCLLQKKLRV